MNFRYPSSLFWHPDFSFPSFDVPSSPSPSPENVPRIFYGETLSELGPLSIAWWEHWIFFLGFTPDSTIIPHFLKRHWPASTVEQSSAAHLQELIFKLQDKEASPPFLPVFQGTSFQKKVYHGLMHIPQGRIISYEALAAFLGNPQAVRAIANAVAANPVAYLIPCHRVLRKSGHIHQYRWGQHIKKRLLEEEISNMENRLKSEQSLI